jgi:hypothetical protein
LGKPENASFGVETRRFFSYSGIYDTEHRRFMPGRHAIAQDLPRFGGRGEVFLGAPHGEEREELVLWPSSDPAVRWHQGISRLLFNSLSVLLSFCFIAPTEILKASIYKQE